jgi:alpha-mannosidase
MPADTFRWRGIDGSDVLAHMVSAPSDDANAAHASIPQYTYVGKMTAAQVVGTWQHYRQQAINDELLYIYGWGDGGGGPTEEMLEAAQVLQQVPGMPQVQPGRVEQFFERLYERVWNHPDLPVWVGELYLEYHRGTYTSQAQVKQANRQAELLYRELEWLNAWAVTLGAQDRQSDLNVAWETILLNQFHDILPGSSIGRVYRDAAFDEHFVNDTADRVGRDIEQVLFPGANAAHPWPTYVLNSLPWERHDTLAWPLPSDKAPPRLLGQDGQVVLTQIVSLPDNRQHLLVDVSTPSYGYTRLHTQPAPEASEAPPLVSAPLRVTDNSLSNAWLRLELDANGEISSLYDIEHQRAIIASKQTGNQLVTYEDRPLDWDAWDIDPFYEEKAYPVQHILAWQVVEQGPIRAAIEITRQVGQSTIRQRICMWHNKRRIDFVTWVDWQERQTLLRALFPLQINASIATCEIQFGAIERPTHRNTSWEAARFEVCAHRWVDLGESGYGVALLNDGKYGHSFHHNVIGLSLLKGATFPDPDADRGNHQFTYSLLPHAGDWRSAQVVRRAYELNAPLHAVGAASAPTQPDSFSFLSTPAAHVVVETIKVAEDGNGLIVRLYEAHNQRGPVRLVFAQPVASAVETDLLEREIRPVEIDGHEIRCHVRPFEVKTLRVWLSAG